MHGRHPEQADVRIKLIGTAQRQIATGWLFSTSIIIEDGAPIRRVLIGGLRGYGLGVGSADRRRGGGSEPGVTVEAVEQAILDAYGHVLGPSQHDHRPATISR